MSLKQPLTAKQISKKVKIGVDTSSYILGKFVAKGIGVCVNPSARNSRLYWTTDIGRKCQERLRREFSLAEEAYDVPLVNWELYGWVCYNHRAAIIRALTEPMQPAEMKRRLRYLDSDIRISANNIRDTIRLFLQKELVQKVFVKKKAHPRYELTELGAKFQGLLSRAEVPLRFN